VPVMGDRFDAALQLIIEGSRELEHGYQLMEEAIMAGDYGIYDLTNLQDAMMAMRLNLLQYISKLDAAVKEMGHGRR
jgi:hypothetical protein